MTSRKLGDSPSNDLSATGSARQVDLAALSSGVRIGKYELIARIGRGGMAEVFLAMMSGPAGFDKLVVVKRMRHAFASSQESVVMFLDEARLAARLNHPNVVATFEAGVSGAGEYYIAMEYLEGQPLYALYEVTHAKEEQDKVPERIWLKVVCDSLKGLHYAHTLDDFDGQRLNVVHRDVSPQNIFLGFDGSVKIVDFGIAKTTMNSTDTADGAFKGKVSYTAPECFAGGQVDARADLFCVGIVLWELLSGHRLFKGSMVNVFNAMMARKIPTFASLGVDVDPRLEAIVGKALEREPGDRFADAQEMRLAIEEYARNKGELATSDDIAHLVNDWFGEHRNAVKARIQEATRSRRDLATSGELVTLNMLPESVGLRSGSGDSGSSSSSGSAKFYRSDGGASSLGIEGDPPNRANKTMRIAVLATVAVGLVAIVLGIAGSPKKEDADAEAPPRVSADVVPVASASPAEKVGRVDVRSTPRGATVTAGDRGTLGVTPAVFDLPVGQHTLVLSLSGYVTRQVDVKIREGGEPTIVSLELPPEQKEEGPTPRERSYTPRRDVAPKRQATPGSRVEPSASSKPAPAAPRKKANIALIDEGDTRIDVLE